MVRYSFDMNKRTVKRHSMDYSDIYDSVEGPARVLLPDVRSLEFRYYMYKIEDKEYAWVDEWAESEIPLAVRVEIEVGCDDKVRKFAKTIKIPIGN